VIKVALKYTQLLLIGFAHIAKICIHFSRVIFSLPLFETVLGVNIAEPVAVFMLYGRVHQVLSWDSTVCSLPLDAARQSRAFQNLPQDLDPRPHAKVSYGTFS
jgi:hypothetical protein